MHFYFCVLWFCIGVYPCCMWFGVCWFGAVNTHVFIVRFMLCTCVCKCCCPCVCLKCVCQYVCVCWCSCFWACCAHYCEFVCVGIYLHMGLRMWLCDSVCMYPFWLVCVCVCESGVGGGGGVSLVSLLNIKQLEVIKYLGSAGSLRILILPFPSVSQISLSFSPSYSLPPPWIPHPLFLFFFHWYCTSLSLSSTLFDTLV